MPKPELSDPVALRLPVDLLKDIERVAAISDRTRSWVIVRALKHYLAQEGADILRVAEGKEQLDHGDTEDMDDVLAEVERIVRNSAA